MNRYALKDFIAAARDKTHSELVYRLLKESCDNSGKINTTLFQTKVSEITVGVKASDGKIHNIARKYQEVANRALKTDGIFSIYDFQNINQFAKDVKKRYKSKKENDMATELQNIDAKAELIKDVKKISDEKAFEVLKFLKTNGMLKLES